MDETINEEASAWWPCVSVGKEHRKALSVTPAQLGSMLHNQSLKKWIYSSGLIYYQRTLLQTAVITVT